MGNKNGGAQPGIVKSDEYPWGLKDITMPIPIEFARKLRNDPATQKAYREFVYNKAYQLVVKFVQYEREVVYKKFYSEEIPDIELVKLNMDTAHLNINISLILLEFMFYIYYELARDEIIKWIKRAESKDDYLDYYMRKSQLLIWIYSFQMRLIRVYSFNMSLNIV
jgi:hypothetical protein